MMDAHACPSLEMKVACLATSSRSPGVSRTMSTMGEGAIKALFRGEEGGDRLIAVCSRDSFLHITARRLALVVMDFVKESPNCLAIKKRDREREYRTHADAVWALVGVSRRLQVVLGARRSGPLRGTELKMDARAGQAKQSRLRSRG